MATRRLKKGFTLVELIVVIAIIGVLAAILVPLLARYLRQSKQAALEGDAKQVYTSVAGGIAELDKRDLTLTDMTIGGVVVNTAIVSGIVFNDTLLTTTSTTLPGGFRAFTAAGGADDEVTLSITGLPDEAIKIGSCILESSGIAVRQARPQEVAVGATNNKGDILVYAAGDRVATNY